MNKIIDMRLAFDTGMNRFFLSDADVLYGAFVGFGLRCLLSHLSCAEVNENRMNGRQLKSFQQLGAYLPGLPQSLENSAGIALGPDYYFNINRLGIALYGGVSHPFLDAQLKSVVTTYATILQRHRSEVGEGIGYLHSFRPSTPTEAANVDCGYADGFGRQFSNRGFARHNNSSLPVLGSSLNGYGRNRRKLNARAWRGM